MCERSSAPDRAALSRAILERSFTLTSAGVRFSKVEIAKCPELVYGASRCAQQDIDPEISGLCVLATSGIPFGAVLSQIVCRPMYIYRRHQWAVSDGSHAPSTNGLPRLLQLAAHAVSAGSRLRATRHFAILPSIPEKASVALVDSHMRTGSTASACCAAVLLMTK